MDVDVWLDHVAPTAKLVFTTTLDQAANDESWGLRNFQLFYPVI